MIKLTAEKKLHLFIRDLIVTYLCESYINVNKPVEPGIFSFL